MGTIRENANDFESVETKNITELKEVSTEIDIEEKEFTKKDGEGFSVNVITVDGEEYRVPDSVLKSLKAILTEKPECTKFKVTKTGKGLKTSYTVIPLD